MITQEQKDKAKAFLQLHHDPEILILLNSWDPGSSMLIEASGYKAIGTTSMGISAALGYPDCQTIPFNEMVEAITRIVNKVSLPVTADVEGGYGKNLYEIIECMKRLIETGVVGINIEDSYQLSPKLVETDEFCERISAIRSLSEELGFHLVINTRTDVFLASVGQPENRLKHSIERGLKYIEAGADCIFVPGVCEKDSITTLVKEIAVPVNILTNPTNFTVLPPTPKELEDLGVARVSVGSSLLKATLALTKKVADDLLKNDSYDVLSEALTPIPETLKAYKMATGQL